MNTRKPKSATGAKPALAVGLWLCLLLALLAGGIGCVRRVTLTPAPTAGPTPAAAGALATPIASPGPTQPPESLSMQGEGKRGGTFTRMWADPPSLDPQLTNETISASIMVEVHAGLVTIDRDLQLVPDLAERWDISPDGLSYSFRLRPGAQFHDGKAVTAQDFKWSLERAADPALAAPGVNTYLGDIAGFHAKLNGQASAVSGVTAASDRELRLTLEAPRASFIAKLTHPVAFALDSENVNGGPQWFSQPNGAGPFRLAEYIPGERLVLERNERYHLGAPYLDSAQFILSGGDGMLMYENDEIQFTGVGLAQLDRLLDPTNPLNKELHTAMPDFSAYYIGLRVDQPPFDDVKARQAFNYAIDKDTIAHNLLRDLLVPARGVLPPGFPAYNPDLQGYSYDPVKAKQLLAESKYGDAGNMPEVVLTLPGSFGAALDPDTEAMLEMWRKNLGVEVTVQQTEWATYLQDQRRGRLQMYGGAGWIADYLDPENFLEVLFHGESADNHTGYANPQVDRWLDEAQSETDQAARYRLYQQAEQAIINDAPIIPLWHGGNRYVLLKPQVKGYVFVPLIIPKLRYVYLSDE